MSLHCRLYVLKTTDKSQWTHSLNTNILHIHPFLVWERKIFTSRLWKENSTFIFFKSIEIGTEPNLSLSLSHTHKSCTWKILIERCLWMSFEWMYKRKKAPFEAEILLKKKKLSTQMHLQMNTVLLGLSSTTPNVFRWIIFLRGTYTHAYFMGV